MIRFSTSDAYPIDLPETHRFPMEKYSLIRQQMLYEGAISEDQVFSPEFLTDEEITLTHSPDFWARARAGGLTDKECRKIGFPNSPQLVTRSIASASGTYRCAENALNDGCGINFAGGTHHAFFDRGEGYCLLNDVAIAANLLLQREAIRKALVIDLDVHQGNGTAALFNGNDSVFTFSMHCQDNYPFHKEDSDLDVPLEAYTDDESYLKALKSQVPKLIEQVQPDMVFYVAGVDVLESDRLGKLSLSMKGLYQRDHWVISNCKQYNLPLVIVMGGGYSEKLTTIVKAHCSTFKLATELYEPLQFAY